MHGRKVFSAFIDFHCVDTTLSNLLSPQNRFKTVSNFHRQTIWNRECAIDISNEFFTQVLVLNNTV